MNFLDNLKKWAAEPEDHGSSSDEADARRIQYNLEQTIVDEDDPGMITEAELAIAKAKKAAAAARQKEQDLVDAHEALGILKEITESTPSSNFDQAFKESRDDYEAAAGRPGPFKRFFRFILRV